MNLLFARVSLHINILSALWTLSALTGLVFSLTILPQYVAKLATAKRLSASNRETALALIRDFITAEANRAIQHALALAVGVLSFFVPPAPRADDPTPRSAVIFGLFVVVVLIANNMLATVNSVRAYVAWRRRYGVVVHAKEAAKKAL
jgi:preprotein translocase subunit Sec61beta